MRYILAISVIFWTVIPYSQTDKTKSVCKSQIDTLTNNTFSKYDQLPEYPGGVDSLKVFISKNLKWPNDGQDDFQGTVIVSVIVESDGSLTNKTILRGIYDLADKEALRIIDMMPKWIPGKYEGKVVPVKYCIPIKFKME
jgi:protein TonB